MIKDIKQRLRMKDKKQRFRMKNIKQRFRIKNIVHTSRTVFDKVQITQQTPLKMDYIENAISFK